MRVDKHKHRATFSGEEGETLRIHYDNRGEPYRQGVTLEFEDNFAKPTYVTVFLDDFEAKELRDVLVGLYPC